MDRLNKDRKKYILSENMDELLDLVDEKFRMYQNRFEELTTGKFDYAEGVRYGEIEGMVRVLTWISMLEQGRSI